MKRRDGFPRKCKIIEKGTVRTSYFFLPVAYHFSRHLQYSTFPYSFNSSFLASDCEEGKEKVYTFKIHLFKFIKSPSNNFS